jgi:hypothetical protein
MASPLRINRRRSQVDAGRGSHRERGGCLSCRMLSDNAIDRRLLEEFFISEYEENVSS